MAQLELTQAPVHHGIVEAYERKLRELEQYRDHRPVDMHPLSVADALTALGDEIRKEADEFVALASRHTDEIQRGRWSDVRILLDEAERLYFLYLVTMKYALDRMARGAEHVTDICQPSDDDDSDPTLGRRAED